VAKYFELIFFFWVGVSFGVGPELSAPSKPLTQSCPPEVVKAAIELKLQHIKDEFEVARRLAHEAKASEILPMEQLEAALKRIKNMVEDASDWFPKVGSDTDRSLWIAMKAHNLRNPLGAAILALELLKRQEHKLTRSDREEFLRSIEINCEQGLAVAATMERGVWNFSTIKISDLFDLVREACAWAPQEFQFSFSAAPDVKDLFGDPTSIREVFGNLITNALVHAFKGRSHGQLSFSARNVVGADEVEIQVSDDGRGMDEAPNLLAQMYDGRGHWTGT
jgi:signal transduction histidine kinase